MIDFDLAISIAKEYFNAKGYQKLSKIYESDTIWIVYPLKNVPQYTCTGISIDKISGAINLFALTSKSNREALKKAKLTEFN